MARGALDVTHVTGQRTEFAEFRESRPADVTRGIPRGVVRARFGCRREFLAGRRLGLQNLVAALHVRIDRLASDEEMLDLAGAFEDAIDAHVAQDAFDGIGLFAALAQRLRRLIPSASANLHEMIRALPRRLGVEQFGHGGLEPKIDIAAVGES